jgi:hypothetical protein
MWNVSHEAFNENSKDILKSHLNRKDRIISSGLFRSNSFDKRFRDLELEN